MNIAAVVIQAIGVLRNIGKPRVRGEVRCVTYEEADKLIRTGEWGLAIPEEDNNRTLNRVYIEKGVP